MVSFNKIYAAVMVDGNLITPEPSEFVWCPIRDGWYNGQLDVTIEWLGSVSGTISYFSGRDPEEIRKWIDENS